MPFTALQLKDRLQPQVAPGNDAEFYRLLTEADERLLNMGRWRWTRTTLTLTPDADRLISLPTQYESVVGCRLGDYARGVAWEELEYMEGGPGLIEIEGCSGRLIDQGMLPFITAYSGPDLLDITADFGGGTITITVTEDGESGGYPTYRSNDTDYLIVSSDGSLWVIGGSGPNFEGGDFPVNRTADVPYEEDWSLAGTPAAPFTGLVTVVLANPESSSESRRHYKVSDTNTTEVNVMARYAPKALDTEEATALCPSMAALKQMMISIIFEEADETKKSIEYQQKARLTLDEQEAAYRGTAKQVFKPSMTIPIRRRSRTNFP